MELVALVSSGKGSWAQLAGVITRGEWDSVIIIGNDFAKKFNVEKDFEFIEVTSTTLIEMKNEIMRKLKGKIRGTEVALSIASGDGKEHMALISALISLPVGIRFTALTKEGIIFM